uniref:Uncharacterized protein n=1 Tax=Panagrolaimus davidi TaxID=227884 RepID=A0A914Q6F4_9BILA
MPLYNSAIRSLIKKSREDSSDKNFQMNSLPPPPPPPPSESENFSSPLPPTGQQFSAVTPQYFDTPPTLNFSGEEEEIPDAQPITYPRKGYHLCTHGMFHIDQNFDIEKVYQF